MRHVKLMSLALCLCAVMMMFIAVAGTVGQAQPVPNSIMQLHLLDCPPPCWIGIIPGQTTVAEAKARIVETYAGQSGLSIKDAGFAGTPIYSDVVEIMIDGSAFYLYIRLSITELIDGKNEIVRSVGLFETRGDRSLYAPTVADILTTFGRPRAKLTETLDNGGVDVTLMYEDWSIVFYSSTAQVDFAEIPRIYLGKG